MKRLLILLVVTGLGQSSKGQVTDTLGVMEFNMGTPFLYTSPNGGYAVGNNGYGDKVKAQTYFNENSFVLREVLMLFGAVVFGSGDSSSVVRVSIYNNYGQGITSYGQSDSIAPDSILGYVDVPVYQLMDDGTYSRALFSDDTLVLNSRFSIGLDLTHLIEGDTVGLISTTDGDAEGSLNAWEMTSDSVWFTVEESSFSWGLDIDFALFPVIDENDPAGLQESEEIHWSIYPTPTAGSLNLRLPESANWLVSIYNMTGKLLTTDSFSGIQHSFSLSHLPNGAYSCVVSSDKRFISKRIILVR